jgi:hypothetical protein
MLIDEIGNFFRIENKKTATVIILYDSKLRFMMAKHLKSKEEKKSE